MRTLGALALLVTLAPLSGCGDGSDARPTGATTAAEASPTASPETATSAEPVDLGDADLVALTSAEICAALSVDDVSLALGTEVSQAEPSTSETPQCTYTYGGDSSVLSTVTVAVQRPEDVGGRGLQDAFDHVLETNRAPADGGAVEEAEVDAGERGVRLSGETLTLSVVASGGRLLTIITTPDLDADSVDALSAAAADAVE